MCDDETAKTVEVPQLTLASAVDLLDDYRSEMERANATGPYFEELSETVERLEERLQAKET